MDEDMYFVDASGRNAPTVVSRTHNVVPARAVAVSPVTSRVGWAHPATAYAPPPAMTYAGYPPASVYGAPPVYAPGPIYGQSGQFSSLFGGLNLGDIVALAADAFAAFKSLPAAPTPTGDVATDVANMDVHMSALAKDAQTRKQIEFAGEIAGRFSRGYNGAW